jgi:transcriptional regulator with XRE-family HTH domain
MSLSSVVRKLRTDKGLRVSELAFQSGIRTGDYNNLEHGKGTSDLGMLLKLSLFFGVPMERFLNPPLDKKDISAPGEPFLMERLKRLEQGLEGNLSDLFVRNMKKFRIARGKTIVRVAQRLGMSDYYYQSIELGKEKLNLDLVSTITGYFEIPIDRFLLDPPKVEEALMINDPIIPDPMPEKKKRGRKPGSVNKKLDKQVIAEPKKRGPKPGNKNKRRVPRPRVTPDMETVGGILITLRQKKKLFQRDLAEKVGLNHFYYNAIEKNRARPSREALQKLADFHGVELDYLLPGDAGLHAGKSRGRKAKTEAIVKTDHSGRLPRGLKEPEGLLNLINQLDKEDRAVIVHLIRKMVK